MLARRHRAVEAWRDAVVVHHYQPENPKCFSTAARFCGESSRFVKKWATRWMLNPSDAAFADKHRNGRPRKVDYAEVVNIIHDSKQNTHQNHAAEQQLLHLRHRISPSTILRAMHDQGWRKHKLVRGAMPSPKAERARKAWALEHSQHYRWENTMMLDSTIIPYSRPASIAYGMWGPPGERAVVQPRGDKLHVYAAVSPAGLSALHECTGTTHLTKCYPYRDRARANMQRSGVGAEEARDVIKLLIAECQQGVSKRTPDKLNILMDRAAPHTSKWVRDWLQSQGYHDFYLPAPGCDINWMDWTVWPTLKQRVYAQPSKYETFEQFKMHVQNTWRQMREGSSWRWLSKEQAKRVAKIAKDGKVLH